ncbi:MAG TPA: hypothetical protein VD815_04470 [Candidatus Saccharimonadales bacterium]|nr:hypothetical protein [Candidatus Saccharimonadales bacterium]
MNKQIQLSILSIFVVAALIGSVVTISDSMVSATKKEKNESVQVLEQFSGSEQLAECATENDTIASCNNVGLALNLQDGNNAGGQQ